MISRRNFLVSLAGLPAILSAAHAQTGRKMARVGYLLLQPLTDKPSAERAALMQGLKDLGYVEDKNIVIEYRSAHWDMENVPRLAREFIDAKVDLIFAPTIEVGIAARQETTTFPIVVGAMLDPFGSGVVASLARPGGNVTGLSLQSPELAGKRLELLKEILPKIRRVAVLRDASLALADVQWSALEKSARILDITLRSLNVAKADDYVKAFAAMAKDRPDALTVVDNVRMSAYRKIITEFTAKHRLPSVFGFAEFVEAGGLFSSGPNVPDVFRRSAAYVDKILKGAKPGDLPIEQPTKFELAINLKTAKALGIKVPPSVMVRAERVIE
jgi:putative ABC transport system substrate-binding protein